MLEERVLAGPSCRVGFAKFREEPAREAPPEEGLGARPEVSDEMFTMRAVVVVGLAATTSLAGCSAEQKSGDELATSAEELKLSGVRYLGQIANGETRSTAYSEPPRYRAFGFSAKAGDEITIDVKSTYGDAMAWLTDYRYNALAANDDASPYTLDAKVTYTIPAGTTKRTYRIVFRDYDLLDATFDVKLSIKEAAPPPPPACDPAKEPWRSYKGTPATCPVIRYTCAVGQSMFENDCGCGCQ